MYKETIKQMSDEQLLREVKTQGDILNICPEPDTRSKYQCAVKEMNKRDLVIWEEDN